MNEDWNLFRTLLPEWRKRYQEGLVKDYQALLVSEKKQPYEKLDELRNRIHEDYRKMNLIFDVRSKKDLFTYLMTMLNFKAITMEDLSPFSKELREELKTRIEDEENFAYDLIPD